LGQVIGLCAANVPCPKCGGDKAAQRAQARLRFCAAQNARTGHFAVTVCYAK